MRPVIDVMKAQLEAVRLLEKGLTPVKKIVKKAVTKVKKAKAVKKVSKAKVTKKVVPIRGKGTLVKGEISPLASKAGIPKKLFKAEKGVRQLTIDQINDAWDSLPIEVRDFMIKKNIKIKAVDAITAGKLQTGRAAGVYYDGRGLIEIADRTGSGVKNLHNTRFIRNTTLHEIGHAIDFQMRHASFLKGSRLKSFDAGVKSKSYKKAVEVAQASARKAGDLKQLSYYLDNKSGAGPKWTQFDNNMTESYAQSFAELMMPGSGYTGIVESKHLASTMKVIRKQLVDDLGMSKNFVASRKKLDATQTLRRRQADKLNETLSDLSGAQGEVARKKAAKIAAEERAAVQAAKERVLKNEIANKKAAKERAAAKKAEFEKRIREQDARIEREFIRKRELAKKAAAEKELAAKKLKLDLKPASESPEFSTSLTTRTDAMKKMRAGVNDKPDYEEFIGRELTHNKRVEQITESVEEYVDDSNQINALLRKNKLVDEFDPDTPMRGSSSSSEMIRTQHILADSINDIDTAINRSQTLVDRTVYRGMSGTKRKGKKLNFSVGDEFTDAGFGSWSADQGIASGFMSMSSTSTGSRSVMFRMNMKAGERALYIAQDEFEFLVARKSKYRVVQVEEGVQIERGGKIFRRTVVTVEKIATKLPSKINKITSISELKALNIPSCFWIAGFVRKAA